LKKPNAFGLHDMCGNVREYCQDFYARYPLPAQTDPLIDMPRSKDHRVVRGGGTSCKVYEIRPGRRSYGPASDQVVNYISFRIVSPLVIPAKQDL
jgi:formylglycine-generating enzyme required for sulfatase activity